MYYLSSQQKIRAWGVRAELVLHAKPTFYSEYLHSFWSFFDSSNCQNFDSWGARRTTHDTRPRPRPDFVDLPLVPNCRQLRFTVICSKSGRGSTVGRPANCQNFDSCGCRYPRIVHPDPRHRVYVPQGSASGSTTLGARIPG